MKSAFKNEKDKIMKSGKILHGKRADNLCNRKTAKRHKSELRGQICERNGNIVRKGMFQHHEKKHSHCKNGQKYKVKMARGK